MDSGEWPVMKHLSSSSSTSFDMCRCARSRTNVGGPSSWVFFKEFKNTFKLPGIVVSRKFAQHLATVTYDIRSRRRLKYIGHHSANVIRIYSASEMTYIVSGEALNSTHSLIRIYRVAQKSCPLPNDQKIVLNRIKACQ